MRKTPTQIEPAEYEAQMHERAEFMNRAAQRRFEAVPIMEAKAMASVSIAFLATYDAMFGEDEPWAEGRPMEETKAAELHTEASMLVDGWDYTKAAIKFGEAADMHRKCARILRGEEVGSDTPL